MRQNKQSISLFNNPRRWLLLAFVASLCLAAVNFERVRAQQPAATPAQKARTKRITPLKTSETADGSRVTITSDGELNDYSAYRSGDRFIVVVPQAEGGGGGARGRGFEGAQVERRGKDLVYTFKLQPGATARVNQRFNRLDVQFSAAKGANANASGAAARPTPTATPTRRTPPEEAGIIKPPTNVNAQPTPDARRTTDPNANANANTNALAAATPFVIPSPAAGTTPSAIATPTATPEATPGADQIAQAQPSIAPPTSITTSAPSTTTPTSVGAVVTRNWPWLLAALLAVGIGLFFVSRFSGGDRDQSRSLPPPVPSDTKPVTVKETKTPELKPSSASSSVTTGGAVSGATPATAATTAATTAAATGATAAAAGLATSGKQSKKKKKKGEKAKRLAVANESQASGSAAATATTGSTAPGATSTGATSDDAVATGGAIVGAGALIAGASALGGSTGVGESKAGETKAVEALATETKTVEPPVAFDPERIEDEIKKLIAGESYDENIINAKDRGTRQLVSAELMSSIAGRNAARQAHARTAFFKHGYFEEATRALQSAEAPGERAAAARTLGILGDRSATQHLTAALEDPSADVRRTSVEALAELCDPSAIGALEALRWRETSRQVPRTLIQRAIEASKVEEETAPAPVVVEDARPTPVVAAAMAETEIQTVETTPAEATETATQETAAEEKPTKELELAFAPPADVEESTFIVAEETGATDPELTVESPALAATETATPEASVAVEETATAETITTGEESKGIEVLETQAFAFNAPPVELAAQHEATAEVETGTIESGIESAVAPLEANLATTLAAKEASLIEARRRESETPGSAEASKGIEPLTTSRQPESPAASVGTPTDSAPATHGDDEPQPVYRSDFAAGSGQPAVGDEDWIDLDADEHEVKIQAIEPAAESPAELPGPFYAEDAVEWPAETNAHAPEARRDETSSLFDSLEVEAFETNAAEPAPIAASRVLESASVEDAQTRSLNYGSSPTVTGAHEESPRGAEIVKADKGLSLADGSDEDTYSIIPKGIQLRLASDDSSERAASVLALSRLNTDEAFNQICAAFDDPMEEVRNAAARAIYDLNEDRADSFTRALRESPVERRRQIGSALAGSGLAEEAIGNLTGESRDKTYDAFSLLFLMAKAGEVAPLIRAIESHPDNEVRLAVVKLLALSGQHEILPSFRRLAVRGSLPTEVRSAVMEAIYQISSQPNAPTPAT
ncbi:MAG TPA: HEAT repeat domain-containing protein [Pyrinomonadaceae bacterium]|nr:HEAT repeat domain-containing protein [Pyrinomonadaceae bacterium]